MLNHTQQDFVADESRCQLQPPAAVLLSETENEKLDISKLSRLHLCSGWFTSSTTFSASCVRWLAVLKKHLLRRSFVELKREIQSFYSDLKTFIDQNNFNVNPVSDRTRLLPVLKCKWSTHLCGVKAVCSEETMRLNGPIGMEATTQVEPCPLVVIWWYQLVKLQIKKHVWDKPKHEVVPESTQSCGFNVIHGHV